MTDLLAAVAAFTAAFCCSCTLAIALTHDKPAAFLQRILAPLLGDGPGTAWDPNKEDPT